MTTSAWFIVADCCEIENTRELLYKFLKKIYKIVSVFLIFLIIFLTFCPSTKQAATIYLLPKITSNKSMQQLPSKTAQLLLTEVKKEINTLNNVVPSNIEIKK